MMGQTPGSLCSRGIFCPSPNPTTLCLSGLDETGGMHVVKCWLWPVQFSWVVKHRSSATAHRGHPFPPSLRPSVFPSQKPPSCQRCKKAALLSVWEPFCVGNGSSAFDQGEGQGDRQVHTKSFLCWEPPALSLITQQAMLCREQLHCRASPGHAQAHTHTRTHVCAHSIHTQVDPSLLLSQTPSLPPSGVYLTLSSVPEY